MPVYLPLPTFLMDHQLPMTARVLYALLLNRANLSKRNGWIDALGRVFVIYPEAEMGKALHKGLSTVKRALNDLEGAGLLERVSQEHSSANRIYVKVLTAAKGKRKKAPAYPGLRDYSYEGEDSL